MMQKYIVKYCDHNSILLINPVGILKKVYCPFRVRCINPVGDFTPDMWLWVEEVAEGNGALIYTILGRSYPHHQFVILITV